uniref:Putative secreted protein n=1 Tax=Anopheles darlingi TaxID=43151 RepID=A0A2M4DSB5_ANODA
MPSTGVYSRSHSLSSLSLSLSFSFSLRLLSHAVVSYCIHSHAAHFHLFRLSLAKPYALINPPRHHHRQPCDHRVIT